MRDVKLFIGGEFVDAADGATFESISPIDNQPIATVAEGGAAEVDAAVSAARHAFDGWSGMGPAGPQEDPARGSQTASRPASMSWPSGRPATWASPSRAARTKDMPRSAHNFRFFADYAEQAGTACVRQAVGGRAHVRAARAARCRRVDLARGTSRSCC